VKFGEFVASDEKLSIFSVASFAKRPPSAEIKTHLKLQYPNKIVEIYQ
jgi:hypothetical protein